MALFWSGGRIDIIERGRPGVVRYDEGDGASYDFHWEFGGGDTVAVISVPTVSQWASALPWAADRRDDVLKQISKVVRKKRCPSCTVRITDSSIEFIES
jgi:hypothetical protein